jgi:hypothetical protein
MTRTIAINSTPVTYFASGEQMSRELAGKLACYRAEFDVELQQHRRMRRIVTTLFKRADIPRPIFYYVLHWSDGTDLDALDHKVLRGDATDEDFAGALLAEPRLMTCLSCKQQLRAVTAGGVVGVFSATDLERWRTHRFEWYCPACGDKSFQSGAVLEFLGQHAGE